MYFDSRHDAGKKLSERISLSSDEQAIVIALSDGATVVAKEIADVINAPIALLLTDTVSLPGSDKTIVGTLDQAGRYYSNTSVPTGYLEEIESEFRNYIETEKIHKIHKLNRESAHSGSLGREDINDKVVIVVSDGSKDGSAFEVAARFLTRYRTKRIVGVVPVASITAVDKLHQHCDEIHCLSVADNYFDTNHYYEDPSIPTHEEIIKMVS